MLLGNIQIEVLKLLHSSESGIPVEDLYHHWGKKEGGQLGVAGLERRGLIRVRNGLAFFERYPQGVDEGSLVEAPPEKPTSPDEVTRENLVITYMDELKSVEEGGKPSSLPHGVRKTLQRLGVLKWKILELTDLGRDLLRSLAAQPIGAPSQGSGTRGF